MADLDPTDQPTPVVFNASASQAVAGTVIGAALIVLTGSTTLLGLLKARDVVGIVTWLHSTDGVAFVAAGGFVATVSWRVWTTIAKHAKALIAARAAPDAVAKVAGDPPAA